MRRLPETTRRLCSFRRSAFLLLFVLAVSGCTSMRPVDTTATTKQETDERLLAARAAKAAEERARDEGDQERADQAFERARQGLEAQKQEGGEAEARSAAEPQGDQGIAESEVDVEDEAEPSPLDELPETTPQVTPREIEEERNLIEAAQPSFDIPMIVNDDVIAYVDYFTSSQRSKFEQGLIRSGRYLPMIQRIFAEEGLPKDLAYMAHVESAYKVTAYSRAKARGIFQFIASTGRRYGLRIDTWVDERSDPEKATRAAAAYLRDLYAMFGDWYLAMAAYNAGEGKVSRGLARTGQNDFWSLAGAKGALKRETRNYVPAILAATLISKDPARYGFEFTAEPPLAYETVPVRNAVSLSVLARCAQTDFETMKQLNPALRRHQTPAGRTTDVRVPVGRATDTLAALETVPASQLVLVTRHRVRSGETLARIAKRYGFTTAELQRANKMGKRTTLRAGQVLVIPNGGEEVAVAKSTMRTTVAYRDASAVVYRVRKGDTLSSISRQFGTTPAAIAAASGISVQRTLRVGDRLRVPGTGEVTSEPIRQGRTAKPVVHTVKRGETLWRIAGRYRISVDALCALNNIAKDITLIPGTRLTIRDY